MTTAPRRHSNSRAQASGDTDYRSELWLMTKMNLTIRGIEGQIKHGDSFHNDRHLELRADNILASPPAVHTPRALAEQRDALLPGLVTGEVRGGRGL